MDKAKAILKAVGGADYVVEIEPCVTRLRFELKDGGLVDVAKLKEAGAVGVLQTGEVVQVVVGPGADALASDMEDLL